jgi:hypothetical protein
MARIIYQAYTGIFCRESRKNIACSVVRQPIRDNDLETPYGEVLG